MLFTTTFFREISSGVELPVIPFFLAEGNLVIFTGQQ